MLEPDHLISSIFRNLVSQLLNMPTIKYLIVQTYSSIYYIKNEVHKYSQFIASQLFYSILIFYDLEDI